MRRWSPALVMLLVAGVSSLAMAQPTYDPQQHADEQIGYWDMNGNKQIEVDEFTRAARGRFLQMDVDGDGHISFTEMQNWRPKASRKSILKKMAFWDRDGNNVITRSEFLKPKLDEFEQMDLNRDHVLSRDELVHFWTEKKKRLDALMERHAKDLE